MENMDRMHKQKHIFGGLFLISNMLQTILDKVLSKYDITAKQWFLTAVIEEFFNNSPPTLSEVASIIGSSRQNIKQIALKLEEKGLLKLEEDERDKRAIRLKLTEKSYEFWSGLQSESIDFLGELFKELSEEELNGMFLGVIKLSEKLKEIDEMEEL